MKKTKHALLLGAVSMLICLSMLVGSTFAWFTDTASTGVNKIVAGNLDMVVEYYDIDAKEWKTVTEEEKIFNDNLYEPGHVEVAYIKVSNAGSLAFKYQVAINIANEKQGVKENDVKFSLSEYLKFDAVEIDADDFYETREDAIDAVKATAGKLATKTVTDSINAKAAAKYYALVVYMPTDVGNEANHMTGEKDEVTGIDENAPTIELGVIVDAMQNTVESDSFDNQYDKLAEYGAKGYETVKPTIPENATKEEASAELKETLDNASDKVAVELPAGEYTLPSVAGKDVVIAGDKNTIIDATTNVGSTGAALTFEGVTIVFDNDNYEGFQHSEKVVYKNCTIKGTQFLYAEAEFINCTFEVYDESTEYNIWTYGCDATFTNCTFNSSGKAILVYNENEMHATVTVDNCTFTSTGKFTDKAAIEVGSSPYSADTTYKIIINESTATGFTANNSTSNLWGNKNSMDQDHLNVILDGVDVY